MGEIVAELEGTWVRDQQFLVESERIRTDVSAEMVPHKVTTALMKRRGFEIEFITMFDGICIFG